MFSGRTDLEVASAGTEQDVETPVSRDLLEWADVVVCMEKRHRERLRKQFRGAKRDDEILTLGLPDEYEFMDPELVALLERLVPHRLEKFRRRLEPT